MNLQVIAKKSGTRGKDGLGRGPGASPLAFSGNMCEDRQIGDLQPRPEGIQPTGNRSHHIHVSPEEGVDPAWEKIPLEAFLLFTRNVQH